MKGLHGPAAGVLLLVLAMAFTACAPAEPQRPAATFIDDRVISTKVRAELAREQEIVPHRINIETREGIVELSGSVSSPAHRQRAEEIARRVEGVRQVQNHLQVQNE